MQVKFKFSPIAAATAVLVAASALVACGGSDGAPPAASTVNLPVASTGNDPFIGVTMTVECASGTGGSGSIGTAEAPGDGIIAVGADCKAPIKITATSKGEMKPIGAGATTANLKFNTAVNLPITNVLDQLPTAATPVTANALTTLVAYKVLAGGKKLSAIVPPSNTVAGTLGDIANAKAETAGALGIPVSVLDGTYIDKDTAGAITLVTKMAALLVQAGSSSSALAEVTATKSLSQLLAEKLATATAANSLVDPQAIANFVKTPGTVTLIDVSNDARVKGSASTQGSIAYDAALVKNIVAQAAETAKVKAATVAELLAQITTASKDATVGATLSGYVADHLASSKQTDVLNKTSQQVADAKAVALVAPAATKTEADTRLQAAQSAAVKINSAMTTALASSGAVPADVVAKYAYVTDGAIAALTKDATAPTKIFAAPPTVGVQGAVDALIAKLENQVATAAPATAPALATYVTEALAATKAAAALSAPPNTNADAYRAALGVVANALGTNLATIATADLQAKVNEVQAKIVADTPSATTPTVVELQRAAEKVIVPATSTGALPTIDATKTLAIETPPTPGTNHPIPDVPVTVVTKAQKDAAMAAEALAVKAATTASTQSAVAVKGNTDATTAAGLDDEAGAIAASASAQTAADAAHAARLAAEAALANVEKAYFGSTLTSAAAIKAVQDASKADSDADAAAGTAKKTLSDLQRRLNKAKFDAAQLAANEAATAAGTASTQAAAAAAAAATAASATTAAAATTPANTAKTASDAAQAAATLAATKSATAASAYAGSQPATDAAKSAADAQASAIAAKASSDAAATKLAALTKAEADAAAAIAAAAASAAADAATAATKATEAAAAATSAAAATTSAAAQPFAAAAATAATAAQAAATHAAAQAALASGSAQASAATASATAAQTSATAAKASSDAAAAKVVSLKAAEDLAIATANYVCVVSKGTLTEYVSGAGSSCVVGNYSPASTSYATPPVSTTGVISIDGGGAVVTFAAPPSGATITAYSSLRACEAVAVPVGPGATPTLGLCKN